MNDTANRVIAGLGLGDAERIFTKDLLIALRGHDSETCFHSERVLVRCADAADILNLDRKILTCAGALHDVGKLMVRGDILRRGERFSADDFIEIKKHPIAGYALLEGVSPFFRNVADVVIRHHSFNLDPYPEKLPECTGDKESIEKCALVVALVDFEDAAIYRKSRKYAINPQNRNEIRSLMLSSFCPKAEGMIKFLFDINIF